MKKFTFLLSLLLAFVGVTASAQDLKISGAPEGGNWAANTQWYLIRMAATDNWHPNAGYLGTEEANFSDTDLRTDQTATPTTDKGLWCIVGNAADGYKFYNKGEGTSKVLGIASGGKAKLYDASATDAKALTFDIASSTYDSFAKCVKCHGQSDGDYWWNNANKSGVALCVLGTWKHADSNVGTRGNAFYFIPVSGVDNASTEATAFLQIVNYRDILNRYQVIPGVATNCATEKAAWEANMNESTGSAYLNSAKKYLNNTYYRITNCNSGRTKPVLVAEATKAAGVEATQKMSNASALWKFIPFEDRGVKLYNANVGAYLKGLVAPPPAGEDAITPMTDDKTQGGLYNISINTSGTVKGFVLRDGDNCRMNMESNGGIDKWEGAGGYYEQVTWTIDVATELEVALNAVNGKSYATTYLPVGVSAVKDAKAYSAATPADGQTIMTETANFAKETGVLLVSDEAADKAVLTIGDVEGAASSSALQGTLLAKDITGAQTKYLVFGKNKANETEVGFFEPSTTVTSIPANRAFFADAEGSAIALNFGNVTAVNNVVAGNANANAPIFDLSGRRVVKAVKGGLYIQNGKKYIVK